VLDQVVRGELRQDYRLVNPGVRAHPVDFDNIRLDEQNLWISYSFKVVR
jgi:hypothetical protein